MLTPGNTTTYLNTSKYGVHELFLKSQVLLSP
jgi:hypothetical protein